MSQKNITLEDIGELKLIEEVILPIARSYEKDLVTGDDCAYVDISSGVLAITSDVGPKPLVNSLEGYENDLEAAGWHGVVATASDIASSGAKPLYLTNCIDAEPSRTVLDFKEYLKGYFRACAEFGFKNAGGDVRHGPKLGIRVSGAGLLQGKDRIDRSSASQGDKIVVIGPAGEFMATYLLAKRKDSSVITGHRLTKKASEILRFPRPQLSQMSLLVQNRLIVSASDSSDSLLGAIDNIAKSSKCGLHLVLDESLLSSLVKKAAKVSGYDPWNIFFCWGDWSVAAIIKNEDYERFKNICSQNNIDWDYLGEVAKDPSAFKASNQGNVSDLNIIRNENFVKRGFNADLNSHLEYMLATPLLY